jgi:hypothetical protein
LNLKKMLKDFEKKVIALLTFGLFTYADVLEISREAELVEIDHTGVGYFLTIRHPRFSQERHVYSKPIVIAEVPSGTLGFVVFIENGKLTLECYSWGPEKVSKDIRETDVQVDPARIENGKFSKF